MDVTKAVELVWLILPAYAANMAPPFVKYWKGWNRPINVRRLGTHKTVVGFALGVAAALIVARFQFAVHRSPYVAWTWWQYGLLQGMGAMAGDTIKSYFKRRRGIAPGARWVPADQLDFVAGALLLSGPGLALSTVDLLAIIAITFVGHIAVNHLAFALHIRDTPW